MMDYNADCVLIEPQTGRSDDDHLQIEQRERRGREQRCSLRQMSLRQEATVLGRIAAGVWSCRLQSGAAIRPGWRMEARLDGETEWQTYEIRRASHALHWLLTVERVT